MPNMKLPTVLGLNTNITLKTGLTTPVILLNNAATTPPFADTLATVNDSLQTYGALHRGAGPFAAKTYARVASAVTSIRQFLGLSSEQQLLFTSNTSAAINLYIRLLALKKGDVIITSIIEHTSNNLPWSYNSEATVVYVNAFADGSLDYLDLAKKVAEHAANLKLIAITGASNLTGYIPDLKHLSDLAHSHGAQLFVDAAQLAPHRPINMTASGIDALAFSAHKVYAPFGVGVLAVHEKLLERLPVDPGGGSIDMISETDIVWAPPSIRHQTGTWNVTGIIATGASCQTILDTGWDNILKHEQELVHYAAQKLATVPGLTMYVAPATYQREDRIGTFCFNLAGYHHALVSAILENEYAIETRAGTICNHRLVRRWFAVSDYDQKIIEAKIIAGDRLASYGIVRASLGIHNTQADVDALVAALINIAKSGPQLQYAPVPAEEVYICTS